MKPWLPVIALTLLAASACGLEAGIPPTKSAVDDPTIVAPEEGPIEGFESEAEFLEYLEAVETAAPSYDDYEGMNNGSAEDSGAPAEPDNENVTNNQEQGVDEGGIVKNVGDYLLVLRKGRLFSVKVAESGQAAQIDSARVAPDEDLNGGVWYDEMLVNGSDVFVIGYRYLTDVTDQRGNRLSHIWGATEINTFELAADGTLVRRGTTFVQSNDYYSWDNSATRMVDGRIIYYMPFAAFFHNNGQARKNIPQRLKHVGGGKFETAGDLFTWKDVVRPVVPPRYATFHTIVSCEASDGALDCNAQSLIGEWWREVYVSRDHVYLWAGERVYAMSQTALDVRTHAVRGAPPSRFAFKQEGETLHVGVQSHDNQKSKVEMLSLPLADFDRRGKQRLDDKARVITTVDSGWAWKNRHVDGWWLFGFDSTQNGTQHHAVLAHRIGTDIVEEFPMQNDTWSSRIEAMPGIGALFVESTATDLKLHTIRLYDDRAELRPNPEVVADVQEGESRSHGFFFKPDEDGGIFGLPIINGGSGNGWGFGVSNIAFFDAAASGDLGLVGTVSSSPAAEGGCETSCVDWYGNTRPIFLRDRIYSLMGSEIQEVEVDAAGLTEIGSRVELTF